MEVIPEITLIMSPTNIITFEIKRPALVEVTFKYSSFPITDLVSWTGASTTAWSPEVDYDQVVTIQVSRQMIVAGVFQAK